MSLTVVKIAWAARGRRSCCTNCWNPDVACLKSFDVVSDCGRGDSVVIFSIYRRMPLRHLLEGPDCCRTVGSQEEEEAQSSKTAFCQGKNHDRAGFLNPHLVTSTIAIAMAIMTVRPIVLMVFDRGKQIGPAASCLLNT